MTDTYPVIGMSPGNSYFKDEVVKQLLKTVVEKYGKTAILVADVPAISTYIALGYPENRARKDKAIPQGNNLKNRVKRAMTELGYSTGQVRIIDWENEIENNQDYIKKYDEVRKLYENKDSFRQSADDATREVLEYSEKEIVDLDTSIKIAVHYLISEIAFMEFAPQYLQADNVSYIYHREWPVYKSYIEGKFDGSVRSKLGYLIVKTH